MARQALGMLFVTGIAGCASDLGGVLVLEPACHLSGCSCSLSELSVLRRGCQDNHKNVTVQSASVVLTLLPPRSPLGSSCVPNACWKGQL